MTSKIVSHCLLNTTDATYHVSQNEADSAPVSEGKDEGLGFAHPRFTLAASGNAALLQPSNSNRSLTLGQSLRVRWKVEEDEARDDGPADGGRSFHDEQPAPTTDPMSTLKTAGDGASEESAKSP